MYPCDIHPKEKVGAGLLTSWTVPNRSDTVEHQLMQDVDML